MQASRPQETVDNFIVCGCGGREVLHVEVSWTICRESNREILEAVVLAKIPLQLEGTSGVELSYLNQVQATRIGA